MTPRERFVLECKRIIDEYDSKGADKELRTWMRHMVRSDIFFLGYFVCERKDLDRDWLFDRCVEVQQNPDGCLDIWGP